MAKLIELNIYAGTFFIYFDSLIKEIYRNKNSSKKELQNEIYKETKINWFEDTFWSVVKDFTNEE